MATTFTSPFKAENVSLNLPHGCLIKLQSVYPLLKRAERTAADFLLTHGDALVSNTIAEIADYSECSQATWVRLSKRLGYTGFAELRAELEQHINENISVVVPPRESALYHNIDAQSSPKQIAAIVFESTINALKDTLEMIDEDQYNQAITALLGAKMILLAGVGDAGAVARSAYQKLFRAGFNVYSSEDHDLQLIGSGRLCSGDVLIAISYSGRTKSVLDVVKHAKKRGAVVIAITNYPGTPLCKNADITLLTAAFAKSINGEIVSKRATQLCVIESLYVNLMLRLGNELDMSLRRSNTAISLNKF